MSVPAVLSLLIVGAGGGLGKALVREALSRGIRTSVLVRSKAKYEGEADVAPLLPRLAGVHEGSGEDADAVAAAARAAGASVVCGALGASAPFFASVTAGAARAGAAKVVHVAGATNVMDEDGVTPAWKAWAAKWPPAESAFKAHGAAIAAARAAAAAAPAPPALAIFCPPYMAARGAVSAPPPNIRINRPGADFVSYEDAAWVMLEACTRADYDGQLITAGGKAPAAKAEL